MRDANWGGCLGLGKISNTALVHGSIVSCSSSGSGVGTESPGSVGLSSNKVDLLFTCEGGISKRSDLVVGVVSDKNLVPGVSSFGSLDEGVGNNRGSSC